MDTQINLRRLWFTADRIYIETQDGAQYWQSLLRYPRLRSATAEQRERYTITFSGLHWLEIDEDVSFSSFFNTTPQPTGLALLFLTHPELNAAAIARRAGMQPSLLAAYLHGNKTPSTAQQQRIVEVIHSLAKELSSCCCT